MMPSQSQIEIPLLKALVQLGGEARPADLYPLVSAAFRELTEDDRNETLPSGGNKWTNRIPWARAALKDKGQLVNRGWGVWAVTDKGRERLQKTGGVAPIPPEVGLYELHQRYQEEFKHVLLTKMQDLDPRQFEQFGKMILAAFGFKEVHVTRFSQDGGIDGYGRLKLGLATVGAAFQCNRWQDAVGAEEIQKFRGAIQGKYEQGIFFTTSTFTGPAKQLSIQPGAVPIVLLDGESIVQLMIEKQVGVRREPLELYYDELDSIFTSNS